jgi:hypothetical protein
MGIARCVIRFTVLLGVAVIAAPAIGQEMKIKQLRMLPDGQMIWSGGATVSKAGVSIPFDSHLVENKFAGYKLESAALQTLKPGDVVLLYFPGLKVVGAPGNRRDATGAKVFGDSLGAWRAVTIDSVARADSRVAVSFNDELTLSDEKKIKRLEMPIVDGFLVPPRPAAK